MRYVHKTESKCFASFYYYHYRKHSHETRRSKLDLERSERSFVLFRPLANI